MAAPAAMQREAIGLATVVAIAIAIAIGRRLGLLRWLRSRLAASDKGRQPVHIRIAGRRLHLLRARLKMLRLRLWLLLMLLVLLARIERLRLARRKRLAAHGRLLILAVIK